MPRVNKHYLLFSISRKPTNNPVCFTNKLILFFVMMAGYCQYHACDQVVRHTSCRESKLQSEARDLPYFLDLAPPPPHPSVSLKI